MKEKDKTYLQHCFLRTVVEGHHTLSEADLISWAANLSLSVQQGRWFCIVAKLTDPDFTGKKLLSLYRQCEKMISSLDSSGHTLLGNNMDVLMLLPYTERSHADIVNTIHKRLLQRKKTHIQVGIGNPYHELSRLYSSKEEACEALKWCDEQFKIADIQEIYHSQRNSGISIQSLYQEIIEQFKSGSTSTLYADLTILTEQVRANTVAQPDAPYPTSIRRTIVELLVEMLHIASDSGVDVDAQIGYVDPYRKIFELQSTPEIILWVTEIANQLNTSMLFRRKRLEEIQLEQVILYIQSHLSDLKLSLSSASQSVGMSPSYFSAFFIREAGLGFKEYVTQERLKLAQKLLRESKDSINSISEQCGFLSPSYFISVFKNQLGITPGAYRKLKN